MADIKEIMQQTGTAAKKVVKNPLFLGVCGVGIILLLWDSGNKGGGSSEEFVTFAPATDYSGYPDVSGDVSTLADNMSASLQEMYDSMTEQNAAMQQQMADKYLQMQEQNAAMFEQMESSLDNKISNMNFVTKEAVQAVEVNALENDKLQDALIKAQEEVYAARKAAEDAQAEAKKQSELLKTAATDAQSTTAKTSSTTAAKTTTQNNTAAKKTTTTAKTTTTKTAAKTTTSGGSTKAVTSSIVNAVIRGDYGNGEARKQALTKAGYNYSQVQAAVNKKLLG